jgi:hypothetical protein
VLGLGIGREYPDDSAPFRNLYSVIVNGTTQSIQVDTAAAAMAIGAGSMSAWVKPNSVSGSGTFVSVGVDEENFLRIWYHHSAQLLKLQIKSGGNADIAQFEDTDFASSSNWFHIVGTWNTDADEMKLYVNNSLKETDGIDNSGDFTGTLAVADIGKQGVNNSAFWKGNIDEVSIFDEALSADQVSTLYNSGSPKDVEFSSLPGLVGYWRMTEGSGTRVTDESGNGNDGLLENSPTWSSDTP